MVTSTLHRRTAEDVFVDLVVYVGIGIFSISVLYPFWFLLVDSFSSPQASTTTGFNLWPKEFSLEPYREVFGQRAVGLAYFNTIFRTVLGTAVTVTVTFCAAYPMAKRDLPFRKVITGIVVFTLFFNGGLIPTYIVVRSLGLLDTRAVLILFFAGNAFILIVTRNFIYTIPESLEESALIDGANEITILLRIIAPLSIPILATITLWTAVMHWNEWFAAMIYVRDPDKKVMQLLLRRIMLEGQLLAEFEDLAEEGRVRPTDSSLRAATLFVAIGPIIVVYPFIQRYFIKGIMVGSVKG